jgi:hypothetical protein
MQWLFLLQTPKQLRKPLQARSPLPQAARMQPRTSLTSRWQRKLERLRRELGPRTLRLVQTIWRWMPATAAPQEECHVNLLQQRPPARFRRFQRRQEEGAELGVNRLSVTLSMSLRQRRLGKGGGELVEGTSSQGSKSFEAMQRSW